MRHGRKALTHFQTFCQTLQPSYRQCRGRPVAGAGVPESVSGPWPP